MGEILIEQQSDSPVISTLMNLRIDQLYGVGLTANVVAESIDLN
jgi:hypothetical protein